MDLSFWIALGAGVLVIVIVMRTSTRPPAE